MRITGDEGRPVWKEKFCLYLLVSLTTPLFRKSIANGQVGSQGLFSRGKGPG